MPDSTDECPTQTAPRKPGTIGTSDRFTDGSGRLWKLTRKGWRIAKSKGSKNG